MFALSNLNTLVVVRKPGDVFLEYTPSRRDKLSRHAENLITLNWPCRFKKDYNTEETPRSTNYSFFLFKLAFEGLLCFEDAS